MTSHGLTPRPPPAVTVRLDGNLTAQVVSDDAGRTLVVHGIRSARTPLSVFSDASPALTAVLADDVRKAAATGRCLDFVPPGALEVERAAPAGRRDRRSGGDDDTGQTR
jgi:hypothetical protein